MQRKKRFAVIVFPGSNCDHDCDHVFRNVLQQDVSLVWHKNADLGKVDGVILPGGFSYGDYLRTGAVAQFSPVMRSVLDFAKKGGLVIGICNGFQILLEAGLLPGAMLRNQSLNFVCRHVHLRVESTANPFLNKYEKGAILNIPVAHGEGNYYADTRTLDELQTQDRILVRYVNDQGKETKAANPNGSQRNIAGICNANRNVFGLMPHPERASEEALGSVDGRRMLEAMVEAA